MWVESSEEMSGWRRKFKRHTFMKGGDRPGTAHTEKTEGVLSNAGVGMLRVGRGDRAWG